MEKVVTNLWTNYGLTALASGTLPSTLYLAVENPGTTLTSTYSTGVSSVTTSLAVHQTGDTQIVLSVGGVHQETVTFSLATVNIDSTCTYNLSSPTTQPHTSGDFACRAVSINDTMTNVLSEQQYDSVNFPGQRASQAGGYSPAAGQWTYQFYYQGPSLQTTLMMVGMCDSQTIGAGNLYNHFVLGYTHNSTTNDLEIDGSLTLSNI